MVAEVQGGCGDEAGKGEGPRAENLWPHVKLLYITLSCKKIGGLSDFEERELPSEQMFQKGYHNLSIFSLCKLKRERIGIKGS